MYRNSLLKTVLSICLMAMCWISINAQGTRLRGDVNESGEVNIADVTSLIDYLLGSGNTVNELAADVNSDNAINIADVTALIDMLLSH